MTRGRRCPCELVRVPRYPAGNSSNTGKHDRYSMHDALFLIATDIPGRNARSVASLILGAIILTAFGDFTNEPVMGYKTMQVVPR